MRTYTRHMGKTTLCVCVCVCVCVCPCPQTEIAKCAECACFRQEQNKDLLMQSGYGVSLLQLLAAHAAAAQPADAAADGAADRVEEAFVTAACGVLRALTTADDDRPPCSKAFPNARLLAKQHQVRLTHTHTHTY